MEHGRIIRGTHRPPEHHWSNPSWLFGFRQKFRFYKSYQQKPGPKTASVDEGFCWKLHVFWLEYKMMRQQWETYGGSCNIWPYISCLNVVSMEQLLDWLEFFLKWLSFFWNYSFPLKFSFLTPCECGGKCWEASSPWSEFSTRMIGAAHVFLANLASWPSVIRD